MAVLGWVTTLGALWIACSWGVAVVLGGMIVRSRVRAAAPSVRARGPAAADPVPRPRRELRVACTHSGRPAGRRHG